MRVPSPILPSDQRPDRPFLPVRSGCEEGQYRNHPSDCNKFSQCIHGKWEERQCFPGLHWNGQVSIPS